MDEQEVVARQIALDTAAGMTDRELLPNGTYTVVPLTNPNEIVQHAEIFRAFLMGET